MKKLMEYVPAFVAFFAVGMGLSSFLKWDPTQVGLRHVTPFGWLTCFLGLAALVASCWLTTKSQNLQGRLRKISHAEARLALRVITYPFFELFGEIAEEAELRLVPEHIEDPGRLASVMRIDVRSGSWDTLLKEQADRGVSRLDRVMQIYAAYVGPDVLEALSELRTSEFLVMRLQLLDEIVNCNQDLKFIEFPFDNGPGLREEFGKFWRTMTNLDRLLDLDPKRLKRRV